MTFEFPYSRDGLALAERGEMQHVDEKIQISSCYHENNYCNSMSWHGVKNNNNETQKKNKYQTIFSQCDGD